MLPPTHDNLARYCRMHTQLGVAGKAAVWAGATGYIVRGPLSRDGSAKIDWAVLCLWGS